MFQENDQLGKVTSDLIVTRLASSQVKRKVSKSARQRGSERGGGLPLCASSLMMLESKQIIQYVLYTTRGRRGGAGALCLSKKGRRAAASLATTVLPVCHGNLGIQTEAGFFPNDAFVPSSAFGRRPEEKGRENRVE